MQQLSVSPRVAFYRDLINKLVKFVSVEPRTKAETTSYLLTSGACDRSEADSVVMQALYDNLMIPVERGSKFEVVKAQQLR